MIGLATIVRTEGWVPRVGDYVIVTHGGPMARRVKRIMYTGVTPRVMVAFSSSVEYWSDVEDLKLVA